MKKSIVRAGVKNSVCTEVKCLVRDEKEFTKNFSFVPNCL